MTGGPIADLILDTVGTWEAQLAALPEGRRDALAGTRWTVRQMLGHLVDSAAFHRQLWIRLRTGDVSLPPYDQESFVALGGHADAPWDELVASWVAHNRLLARAGRPIPEAELANRWLDKDRTLGELMDHYVEHMHHHLESIRRATD